MVFGTRFPWKGLCAFGLILLLAGCAEAQVVIPTRIILPTATLTPAPHPAILPSLSTATATISETAFPSPTAPAGRYFSGDIHTHSWLSDGKHSLAEIVANAFHQYGLDYLANSDHGGVFPRHPDGLFWDDSMLPPVTLLGESSLITIKAPDGQKTTHAGMWRWQSLRDFSWPLLFGGQNGYNVNENGLQAQYSGHTLIQGLEWNMPAFDHAGVGIINQKDGSAISDFEYQFDANDTDTSRKDLHKQNTSRADTLKGIKYLASHYDKNAYVVINHPSRTPDYSISAIRDLIDAAPQTVIGLEGFPGHQKSPARGDYFKPASTYGGADVMLAQVGGVMDALWGEGRHFWVLDDSDFHSASDNADFWPGEYAKTYTFANSLSASDLLDGMRSGNMFLVQGDLINALDFEAKTDSTSVGMGSSLAAAPGSTIHVVIRFQSPKQNNHGDPVRVDHIDLIGGDIHPKAEAGSKAYQAANNPSTRVIKTFSAADWSVENGWNTLNFTFTAGRSGYLRLRGSNMGLNEKNQTQDGNPLMDDLVGKNNAAQAWDDLWFYSNPIFITVP
jgi:hypothetical protein